MSFFQFRVLLPDEIDAGMAIITDVTDWLLSKGVRQWMQPLPREIYAHRHQRGENYGLFVDGELAAVVSLIDERPAYWEEWLPNTPFRWLATLASSRRYKGQGLGAVAIGKAEQFLTQHAIREIYLDCVYSDGTLPEFYESLGYEQIARKDQTFSTGTFDSVLMKKSLPMLESNR
jgi:GNAT superfamily N-acetyltransferase